MPRPQMIQTLVPVGEGPQIPTRGARTLDVVDVEAVPGPVREADEMLGAVSRVAETVALEVGAGFEV
jgi:hypothetical protein